jgi:hypothetical protein
VGVELPNLLAFTLAHSEYIARNSLSDTVFHPPALKPGYKDLPHVLYVTTPDPGE